MSYAPKRDSNIGDAGDPAVAVAGTDGSGDEFIGRGSKKNYYELHDRIVYAVVPFAAYGLHVFGGVLFFHAPQRGLTLVAAGMLSLLAVAIGNSWAITVDVVSTPRGQRNSKEPTTKRIGT